MHILIAVLGAVAAALWAFTYFMQAASGGGEAIGDIKNVIRRGQWNRRVDKRLIENLSDPREAAAVLIYQMAAYDGAVTERQHGVICAEMRRVFQTDNETAEALFAFGRMAVGEIADAANSLRKILRPVTALCTPAEKQELIAMAETAAEIEGPPNELQRRLSSEMRRCLMDQ